MDISVGARFIPVLQLKLAKHMVEFPQPHLDMCTATDLRRYLSIIDNDVAAVNKNVDALFVGLSSSLQTIGALAALFVISPVLVSLLIILIYLI
jgi:ABC-type multidrug transport system fused ATPase/permease subunit